MNGSLLNQERLEAFAQLRILKQAIESISPRDPEVRKVDELIEKLNVKPYTVAVVGNSTGANPV